MTNVRIEGSDLDLGKLSALLIRVRNDENLPGLVAHVVVGDRSASVACGFNDAGESQPIAFDERLRLSSMTKPFTAAAVLQLVVDGAIDIDEPVAPLMKELHVDDRVTVRHLLSHTSGLTRAGYFHVDDGATPPTHTEFYAAGPLVCTFPPGSATEYSNHGYAVLGQLVEDLTGTPFALHLQQSVLSPIGATIDYAEATRAGLGFEFEEDELVVAPNYIPVLTPASGGWATAADIAQLAAALCQGDGGPLGPIAGRVAPNIAPSGLPPRAFGWAMSAVNDQLVLSHAGGWPGYSGNIAFCPSTGIAVAVIVNMSAEARGELGTLMIDALQHSA